LWPHLYQQKDTEVRDIMDTNGDSASKRESFWRTVPGVLTAFATLLTALAGMLLALNQIKVFDFFKKADVQHVRGDQASKNSSDTGQQSVGPVIGLHATADDITYTILFAQREFYSPKEKLLIFKIKLSCKRNGVNFDSGLFRLEVDGSRFSPHSNSSNKWVEPYSDWVEKVQFIVPNDAQVVNLLVGSFDSERISKIPISLDEISLSK